MTQAPYFTLQHHYYRQKLHYSHL